MLAELYIDVGDHEKAVVAIKQGILRIHGMSASQIDFDNDDEYNNTQESHVTAPIELRVKLGICRLYLGDSSLAETHFLPLYEMQVDIYGDLFLDIVDAYMACRKFASALNVLDLLQRNESIWFKVAKCYHSLGSFDEAIAFYKREAYTGLGEAYEEIGDERQAVEMFSHDAEQQQQQQEQHEQNPGDDDYQDPTGSELLLEGLTLTKWETVAVEYALAMGRSGHEEDAYSTISMILQSKALVENSGSRMYFRLIMIAIALHNNNIKRVSVLTRRLVIENPNCNDAYKLYGSIGHDTSYEFASNHSFRAIKRLIKQSQEMMRRQNPDHPEAKNPALFALIGHILVATRMFNSATLLFRSISYGP
eukprot:jgi/Hompol1/1482/HPOL_005604-RA